MSASPVIPLRVLACPGHEPEAIRLAERLRLPCGPGPSLRTLIVSDDGLIAAEGSEDGDAESLARSGVRVDLQRARPGGEPVVRAARARPLRDGPVHVVDATGGFGVDAGACWRAGLRVTVVERDPVVAALLEDGVRRLRAADPDGAERFRLLHGDAREILPGLRGAPAGPPEVVYLDPMYPRARGGAKRRGAAWLRSWLGPTPATEDAAEGELLAVARSVAARRVVVKRPIRAEPIAAGASGALRGTTTRFDLYAPTWRVDVEGER